MTKMPEELMELKSKLIEAKREAKLKNDSLGLLAVQLIELILMLEEQIIGIDNRLMVFEDFVRARQQSGGEKIYNA